MNELFTIREVAEKLKISVSSIYRYVESGRFAHTRIGSNIRFTNDHVADFLASENKSENQQTLSQVDLQPIYEQW